MLILRWLINAIALLLVAKYVPGFVIGSTYTALVLVVVLGLINAVIRPVFILLTLPINVLTLGLFTFVINAAMLMLASTVVKGFEVQSFSAALAAAIILWLISFVTNLLLASDKK